MGISRLGPFQLLTNQTVNTTGAKTAIELPFVNYLVNGMAAVHFFGNLGGGRAAIEVTPDDGGGGFCPQACSESGSRALDTATAKMPFDLGFTEE